MQRMHLDLVKWSTVMDKSVLIYQVVGRHIHHQLSYTRTIKTLQ